MEHIALRVSPRGKLTKGELRQERKKGRLPAQIYGKGIEPISVFLEGKEFANVAKRVTESRIIDLDLEGKKFATLLKEIQKETISGNVIHIDFNLVRHDRNIHVRVPLHLNGVAKGVKDGGILEHSIHEIEVECDSDHLPEKIEVDITDLEANHALHLKEVALPEGVKLVTNPDTVFAIIKFAHGEPEKALEPEAEEAGEAVASSEQESAETTSEAVHK
ncbi:MAG TPA: 50S ribosomal protein L25 [Rectinema sp.]|jgi:large subunit ribosomal protein L25|nr:50S ribosomal protein L25 [Spirochaetia bacterium]NLH89586.1 50S ribosomal protein L25 [Treponema sp.]OQC75189.1 MAG: 50S ribosomal protein L25 [Spirochaetes bacterium ADurb.Bin001]HOC26854.1 50S ribosomal protein L25 [Rectinema sp.]HOH16411.1 50S ribosomal protein L25 [Rectinema sp.]